MKLLPMLSLILALAIPTSLFSQAPSVSLGTRSADVKLQFGKPVQDLGSIVQFESCAGSESDVKWSFVFLPNLPDSTEPDTAKGGRLTTIQRNACGAERFNAESLKKEISSFLPGDAKLVRQFKAQDGRDAWEYNSQSLSKTFAAADFLGCDAEGRVIPNSPGTFSSSLAQDGSSWVLALGTCL